jgi:hypothetical protein
MTARARAARRLVDFDSGVNMVRALARFLQGKDFGGLSVGPNSRMLADAASSLPAAVRRRVFTTAGLVQGVPLDQARTIDTDDIARWVVRQYPARPYPVVAIGAASGAALHLAAALRAPYLPQTTLTAVRDRSTHPDDPIGAMDALAPTVRTVAANNPEVSVYHMHDPAQDRPMLEAMAYLRLKRHTLGRVYERFLEQNLTPGGTLLIVECTRTWRSRSVGERAYFQFGCLGGLSEDEYHHSGDRVADYLARQGSWRRAWHPPQPDARRPEAEWGFDAAMNAGLEDLADKLGFRLRRLVAEEPQDFSPFIADLHRWWFQKLGLPTNRLLVESYVQWDPLWMLTLGAVPLWMRFNMGPDYTALDSYLASAEPYDEIYLNLFSQGLWSPGVVGIEQWRALLQRAARGHAAIIGVDTDAYPLDTGSTARFQRGFRSVPARHHLPAPLSVIDVDEFVANNPQYAAMWSSAAARAGLPTDNIRTTQKRDSPPAM